MDDTFAAPQRRPLRQRLIYGEWQTSTGDRILFDRRYKPRWRKTPDGAVAPADPGEWIADISNEVWFYNDRVHLRDRKNIAAKVAAAWNIPL